MCVPVCQSVYAGLLTCVPTYVCVRIAWILCVFSYMHVSLNTECQCCMLVCLHLCLLAFTVYHNPCVCLCVMSVCVHVALSDLPRGLYGPDQMVGNINFTIPSPPPPPLLLSPCIISPLVLPSPPAPLLLLSSPPRCLTLCGGVITFPPLSTSDLRGSVCASGCVYLCVFGDWLVIWAARRCVLCGAIHGRRLQMNASIHNYSLSISCSPLCLVVVFSSSLQEKRKKKQLKQDKNKLEHKQCTWKKTAREGVWECVCGAVILQSGFILHTISIWTFMHECISSKRLTRLLNVGYIF